MLSDFLYFTKQFVLGSKSMIVSFIHPYGTLLCLLYHLQPVSGLHLRLSFFCRCISYENFGRTMRIGVLHRGCWKKKFRRLWMPCPSHEIKRRPHEERSALLCLLVLSVRKHAVPKPNSPDDPFPLCRCVDVYAFPRVFFCFLFRSLAHRK